MKLHNLYLFLVFFLITNLSNEVYCQEIFQNKIDSIFKVFSDKTPGISISLVDNNESVLRQSYGNAQLEYEIPVNSKTVFHIASDSKRFTALAILLLESEGKLSLSDSIQTYLSDFPSFKHKITIENLLQHTSGLRDQWQLLGMAGWRMEDIVTQEQIIKVLYKQQELNFVPKSEFVYSNSGYTLLAEIVKVVTGKSFENYTNEHIFEPLGMTNTHFHTNHKRIVKNRAYSYSKANDSTFQKEILNFANAGATGLFTTVEDLEKWLFNVMSDNPKVGSKSIFKKMQKQLVLDNGEKMIYGMGEMVFNIGGKKLIGHGGNDAGFNSFIGYYPEYNVGVIALCNWREVASGNLIIELVEDYLKDSALPKNKNSTKLIKENNKKNRKFIKPNKKHLDKQVGIYETIWGNVFVNNIGGELYFKNVGDNESFMLFKAESKHNYYNKENEFELVFSMESKGVFNKLKITGPNNTNFSAQRIYLADYSMENLKEFEGIYRSSELNTEYIIELQGDSLMAKHFRHSNIPLIVKSKDRFSGSLWYFDLIEFTRDSQNRINGLLISGGRGRAKNVRFNKK
ncbi:serine hydrolase domain-containing protein [uncultured Psychroserpens sp.]|uniref:serine hydrolase domain-containing protein n=1 Tax=uncultured Psychroserpens sp. TaxID=255436 RepID=UPI00260B59C1|nr:serine hydrolase domain-containing protein [uncultured Psychroserpens sp.]